MAALALLTCALGGQATARAETAGASVQRWLQGRISQLVADPRLEGSQAGVAIVDLGSGRVIVEHNGGVAVSIASNAKLFTAAAALSHLGSGFRFKTTVRARRRRGSRVSGELYVKGHGDPSIREHTLWRIARDVRNAGIRRVSGGLTIDESYLDAQRLAPLFETRKTDAYYRPAIGALSLEDNVVWIGVRPAERAGRPATVLISPRCGHVSVEGQVKTVGGRYRNRLKIRTEVREGNTVVLVDGRIRRGSKPLWQRKRVADPGIYFATTFRRLLRENGVRLGRRAIRRGRVPRRARLIVEHRSEPLARIISQMNKSSSNAQAELVLKVLGAVHFGRTGSTRLGLRAVNLYLDDVGLAARDYQLRNGSGLYEATRFSPRQVVQLLAHLHGSFRVGSELMASLPIAGVDGTLARRFRGSGAEAYVRAKTGTLAKVVALSGYAGASRRGAALAFSILLTELPPGATRQAREVADEMAQAMVNYLELRPVVTTTTAGESVQ